MTNEADHRSRRRLLAGGGLAAAAAVIAPFGAREAANAAAAAAGDGDSSRSGDGDSSRSGADDRGTFDVVAAGADPSGGTDSTAAFARAITAAAAVRGRVTVPSGDYLIDSLTVPLLVKIEGLGADISRYGAATSGGVNLKHRPDSTKPLLIVDGGGVTLENLGLQGNGAAAPLLLVQNGFESRLSRVQLSGVPGTALHIERVNNNYWTDVFVNNSGSLTAAAMVVKSPPTGTNSNTVTFANLTIEGSPGPALDLAYGSAAEYYVEFVRLIGLHVEGLQKFDGADALIRIGSVRQVEFVSPVLYGGPGPLIQHDERRNRGTELTGGVRVLGGVLLGVDPSKVSGPSTRLVALSRGDDFAFVGTRLGRFSEVGIDVEAKYGSRVMIDPSTRIQAWGKAAATRFANPANNTSWGWQWPASVEVGGAVTVGRHLSRGKGAGVPAGARLSGVGAGAPDPRVTGTDLAGSVTATAGSTPDAGDIVRVTFAAPYAAAPVVVISPQSATAASCGPYVVSTATHFDIGVTSPLRAGATVGFGFAVIG